MIDALGGDHSVGHTIKCGQPLISIYSAPSSCVTVPETGLWDEALASYEWDFVTYQPYPGLGATLQSDENVINAMADLAATNPANTDTKHLIYAAYPTVSSVSTWGEVWGKAIADSPSTPSALAEQYYNHLMPNVRASQTVNEPMLLIPVGHVYNAFDQQAKAGAFPGFTGAFENLYRDQYHANDLGKFISGTTFYSVMFQENPIGLDMAGQLNPSSADEAMQRDLEALVWNVVRSNQYTGLLVPGDMDGDQNITAADVSLFVQAITDRAGYLADYPGTDLDMLADFDGNGRFDLGDLDGFGNMFSTTASAATPEPASLTAAVFALLGMLLGRPAKSRSRQAAPG